MKKQIILAGLIAIVNVALAQVPWSGTSLSGNTHRTGNVGIGNTSPAKSLDILSGIANDGIMIKQTTSGHATLRMDNGSAGGLNYGFCSTGYLSQEGAGHFFLYDHSFYRYRIFFNSNGNVGIGDNLTSPQYKLDISSAQLNDGINITQTGTSSSALHLTNTSTGGKHWALFSTGSGSSQQAGNFSIYDYNAGKDRLFINGTSGNVGVGTNAPNAALDIAPQTTGNPAFQIFNPSSPTYSRFRTYGDGKTFIGYFTTPANDYDPNGSVLTVGQTISANKAFNVVNSSSPSSILNLFTVWGNGNIGVGIATQPTAKLAIATGIENGLQMTDLNNSNATTFLVKANGRTQIGLPLDQSSPHYGDINTMLTVKGKIVSREIIVTISNWADYVFAKNYKLNDLNFLENYIKENNHLPNVPCSKDIETNGVGLGEMSKIQMEKIEELTLYVIELKKEIEAIKKENKK